MLIPSRVKHRRVHRLKYEGKAKGNKELHFENTAFNEIILFIYLLLY